MIFKTKILPVVLILVLLLSVFSACSFNSKLQDEKGNAISSDANYPVSVYGVKFESAPTAVVSLSDSITDIIHVLKYDSLLVGRDNGSVSSYTENLPKVGIASNLDVDTLVSLGVNFIISEEPIVSKQVSQLNDKGIKVLSISQPATFDELQSIYTNLGAILGGAKEGYENAYKKSNDIFVTIENINKLITQSDANTACYLYDTNGTAVTGDTLANKLMELSGARNIAANCKGWKMPLNDIFAANPAYIFCPVGMKAKILEDENFKKNLWAVSNSRVVEMDSTLLSRYGSTMIDAITFMASTISPDLLTKSSNSSASSSSAASSAPAVSSEAPASSAPAEVSSAAASSSGVPEGTVLQLYSTGDEVTRLQARLKELGHDYMDPSGTFDEYTEEAVKNFQYLSDFEATGVADEKTLNALYSPDAITGPNYGL